MKRVNLSSAIIVVYLILGIANPAISQDNTSLHPVGIDFFTHVKSISNVKTIGNDIFFTIRQASTKDDKYTTDIYQLVDGKAKQLTNSGRIGGYDVLDDAIVFRKIIENETVFMQLTRGYGEATEWLRLPYKIGQIKFLSRNHFFFTASHTLKQTISELPDSLKAKDDNRRYRIFDEIPFWSNGRGDINGLRSVLYEYKDGKVTPLTDSLSIVAGFRISNDKHYLAYTISNKHVFRSYGNNLYLRDIRNGYLKNISVADSTSHNPLIFIDNCHLFVTVRPYDAENPQANSLFFSIDITSGKSKQIYNGDRYEFGVSLLSDVKTGNHSEPIIEKSGIVYNTTAVDQAPLVRLPLTGGEPQVLTPNDFDVDEYLPYQKGYLLLGTKQQNGQELYYFDGKNEPRLISNINGHAFADILIAHPREILFKNKAGKLLRGYVLPPANYEQGRLYPTILNVHGGPKCAYGKGFFHEMQYWSGKGYAVIFTNPRGSSGNGSDFAKLKGDFGGRDYDDLMDFVDAAISQTDFIDEKRLGITGGSYGGVMTNWVIGHTDRFRAAASQRSISNWVTLSGISDIGYNFVNNYVGADVWTDIATLWKQSPLAYANKVKAPTLFIHSEEDYRCPLPEGLQMYSALQYFNVPSRIVIFKNENHELSRNGRPLNRIKRLDEITHWFDKYLK